MVSKLYKLADRYALTHTPSASGLAVYNPVTRKYEQPTPAGQPVTFEVHLEKASQLSEGERPGLEDQTMRVNGRVVKTPGSTPLEFPKGVKAGDTFHVTLFGTKGKLELLPTPDPQIAKVRQKLGAVFEGVFKAVG